jgi:RNA polymerase sigma-70 factor (ECF subfamily)
MFHPPPVGDRGSGHGDVEPSTEACLETLVDENRTAVFNYACCLTRGDVGWAEDVVQETFLRAWRHRKHMTPEHDSIRGWLMRVAHNLVMERYRSARMRRGELPLDEADEVVLPESTDQILSAHMVRQALYLLPERHRQALEATYLSDQTTVQAAREH